MSEWATSAANVTYTEWLMDSVWRERGDDAAGSAGVREPRRPIRPLNTSGAALEIPRDELQEAVERGRVLAERFGW